MKRGKKIDVFLIKEGAQRHSVEIRWDRNTGDFFATLGGVDFTASTSEELKGKLRVHAKTMVGYDFKWYLLIDFGVSESYRRGSGFYSVDWEDLAGDEERIVAGIEFAFQVVERSQAIESDDKDYRGDKIWIRLGRDVDEVDGKLQAVGEHSAEKFTEENDDTLIEFTPERYAKLCAIRAAMKELARRLHEIVGGSSKDVTKVLDGLPSKALAFLPPREK